MKVVGFGGSGFLGSKLSDILLKKVLIFDKYIYDQY